MPAQRGEALPAGSRLAGPGCRLFAIVIKMKIKWSGAVKIYHGLLLSKCFSKKFFLKQDIPLSCQMPTRDLVAISYI